MRKIKQLIILLCLLVSIIIINGINVNAATTGYEELTLHEQTKVYSSNNSDYFYGCEDYVNYVNNVPSITVLTHGLGSSSYYWSNSISVDDGNSLAYNENSLIDKIYQRLNGNVLLYLAAANTSTSFTLSQLSRSMDVMNETDRLNDVSKHIVIIYDSSIPSASNSDVYEEFELILDNISMQYKSLTGVLPRLNLVGHSRGGLTNIMYATEHPYNVASMYSLGTPYNGSVLGGIDAVLKMLGYYDDTTQSYIPGVQSILDYNEAVQIRNAWNTAYTADANINVVAFGSMTSIDYIEQMIYDVANGGSVYSPLVEPYIDVLETALNVIKRNPNLTGETLEFIQGLAEVSNAFGINLYDEVLSIISSDLEGSVTYEEGQKILSLYNVINGQPVIMDDLFIDLNSQLGYGFNDGIAYNGFKRYVKIFNPEDLTENRSIPTLPAIIHNMETMNATYTNIISSSLIYGSYSSNIITLTDDSTTLINLLGEKAFSFNPNYTGTRQIEASFALIKIYKYNANNGLELILESQDIITFKFESNQKYMIVISSNQIINITVFFKLLDTVSTGDNYINFSSNEKRVFKLTVSESGYYLISLSSSQINLSGVGVTKYDTYNYYVYLSAGVIKHIYLVNNASYNISINLSITVPQEIDLNAGEFTINSSQKVVKFVNPYNVPIQYQLKIEWTTSTSRYATIYNKNNSSIGSVITGNYTKTYSFTLGANDSCYIIFSNIDYTISATLSVNPTQLKWKINGSYSFTTTTLARNKTYTLQLVLYVNGTEVDYYSDWAYTSKPEYFTILNNQLNINYNALVGYDIIIIPTIAPEYMLTITIGFNNTFSYYVSNNDKITLNWNTTLYNEALQEIAIRITSGGVTYNVILTTASGTKDITPYISTANGTSTVSITSIEISGITFDNGTSFLNKSSITFNNLYAGGNGTSSSPYTISCYRHLNNIRKNTSSYFKLLNDIDLQGKGDWVPISSFYGIINGNYYYIKNMKINVDTSGGDYGFIKYNYGVLNNLKFSYAQIYTTLSEASIVMYVGVVSGYNGGDISNCDVSNSTIDVQFFKSRVGGIVGYNSGYIYDSDFRSSVMKVSGYAGGISGYNSGTVEYSDASSVDITYYWIDDNGCIGGIIGYNIGAVNNCNASVMIRWTSPSNNRNILPSLGFIIGYNSGAYENCSTGSGYEITYYYWHFIGWYDQSDRCFKVDDGKVGYSSL